MSLTTITLLIAVLVSVPVLTGLLMMYRSMYLPTRGRRIATYPDPKKALVVLDIQEGYVGAGAGGPVTAPPPRGVLATVNRLIDRAAETGVEVAYIRQVFSNNLFVRLHGGRRMGKVIVDRRIRVINGNDFEKNRTDAFSSRPFEQFLIDRQVDELFLVGVDAAYCVYFTALGALQRGYKVTVVQDAVMSRKAMPQVLERYRRRGIRVIASEDFLVERGLT